MDRIIREVTGILLKSHNSHHFQNLKKVSFHKLALNVASREPETLVTTGLYLGHIPQCTKILTGMISAKSSTVGVLTEPTSEVSTSGTTGGDRSFR